MPNDKHVVMEGVKIIFRNFEGKEQKYNKEGDRNFAVLLDDDVAERMAADGWNVKQLKVREEDLEEDPDATPQSYLPVAVGYSAKSKPPRIVLITDRGKTNIDEDTVGSLDWVDIQNVDLIVRPYVWEVNGGSGVKAYLQSMYITVEEDELDKKYADLDSQ